MKPGFFSLRWLRWKLTFSYTLVTVVALLALELSVIVAVIAFLSSPILPYLVAPRMQPGLSQTPPDVESLKEEVAFFANYEDGVATGERFAQGGGSLDLTLGPDDGYLLVVDDERRLLATSRELEVLKLIAEGHSNAEISSRLFINEKTTKSHVSNILSKLHLADRTQAAAHAWRQGVVRRD